MARGQADMDTPGPVSVNDGWLGAGAGGEHPVLGERAGMRDEPESGPAVSALLREVLDISGAAEAKDYVLRLTASGPAG